MRAIVVMFDSLNRHYLPVYNPDCGIIAPNFERLATRAVTFDQCYAGSMPCMPARREMHTGRYNFLHRGWGPGMDRRRAPDGPAPGVPGSVTARWVAPALAMLLSSTEGARGST